MSITYYSYYYDELDWELQQVKESGDAVSTDRNKLLPFAEGKRIVNQLMKTLVRRGPNFFEEEYTYTFAVDTNTFTVPFNIYKVMAYLQSTGKWTLIPDSSDRVSVMISKSHNTIYYSTGWEAGDTATFKVIRYPDRITGDYDMVAIPEDYRRLLTLMVKRWVYARKGKAFSDDDRMELEEYTREWARDGGPVMQKTRLAFKGHAFGRTRG